MSKRRARNLEKLRDAERSQHPVRVWRDGYDSCSIDGFVASVTEKWVAIQTLQDAVYLDGYTVVRMKHVSEVEQGWRSRYIERALEALGRPTVDVTLPADAVTKDVLACASRHSTMVAVQFEKEEGEPMWVGHTDTYRDRDFSMWFIQADGEWELEPRATPYGDVTKVLFGDRYTDALKQFGERREP